MAGWQYVPPGGFFRDDLGFEGARPGMRRRMVSEHIYPQQPVYYPPPPIFVSQPDLHRSRSTGHRMPVPPIQINNVHEENPMRGRQPGVAPSPPQREASASRGRSRPREESPHRIWQRERDNEQLRAEVEAFRQEKERIKEETRIKEEIVLKKALEEQQKREEAERRRQIEKQAIEDFKWEEQARLDKEKLDRQRAEEQRKEIEKQAVLDFQRNQRDKAEREQAEKQRRDEEYMARVRKEFNLSDAQIARLRARDPANAQALEPKRKTFTKIARRHISLETLRFFELPYKLDDVRSAFFFSSSFNPLGPPPSLSFSVGGWLDTHILEILDDDPTLGG